jgi:hypothetical protein
LCRMKKHITKGKIGADIRTLHFGGMPATSLGWIFITFLLFPYGCHITTYQSSQMGGVWYITDLCLYIIYFVVNLT